MIQSFMNKGDPLIAYVHSWLLMSEGFIIPHFEPLSPIIVVFICHFRYSER